MRWNWTSASETIAKSGLNSAFVLRQRAALLRFSQLYTGGDPSAPSKIGWVI